MDAFFASVEVLDDPALSGKPVVVGGSPTGRGVVAAASYESRKFGIRSAMPMAKAVRLCPNLVIVRPRMARYSEISKKIHEIFSRFTPLIEPISLDEAFLDVTGSIKLFKNAENIGRSIKSAIKEELGLVASVGIAPNKFLAKLASDLQKPDGFVVITEKNKQAILDPLPIRRLWGIGGVTEKKLLAHGIKTIADLRTADRTTLKSVLGNTADTMLELASGIDNRTVELPARAKSISNEITFPEDIADKDTLLAVLMDLVDQVTTRLRDAELLAKTVNLKLRYGDFTTITRSRTLGEYTNLTAEIWHQARDVFNIWYKATKGGRSLRLLGFGVSSMAGKVTGKTLFDDQLDQKQKTIDSTVDKIKHKYGKNSIKRKY
jgi:DNA polymerase-4